MATKVVRKRSTSKRAKRIAKPSEVRAAYGEIQKGVAHLDASIVDIRAGLHRAERKIKADARRRIRTLRTEARAQLRTLRSQQREAARTLKKVSAAAGESWEDVKRSADAIFADARATAVVVGKRFRSALKA
jgi:hypothetical protein